MAQYDAIVNIGGQFDERAFESKLQQSLSKVEKGIKFTPFSGASRNVRDFSSELDRANQRVITLGASFAVLSTSIRVFKDIISSTIAVEKALTDINSVFGLSIKSMEQFSRGLFNVARETSQSFEMAAEAAKEFSRQGLGAEETLKRTRDALILTRLASLNTQEAISTLTASINGFQKAALDSTQIVNKLATVDAQFAVSSKDLAQGLARAGAAASDAGVSFDELIGLITSAQQTTARGGAVIGNSLKTIFTRVERKDTIEAFEALGVAVTDLQGNMVPAIQLLKNFATTYDKLGGTVKKQAAELVGGVYQINILKALLSDLEKGSNSVAEKAAKTSAAAADEAIKRNEALNKSLAALLQQSQTTYQQIGSKVGDLGIGGAAKNLIGGFNTNPIIQALANAGDADTNSFGEKAAAGFIKGFGNAVVFGLGPSIIMALGSITRSVFLKVQRDFADIIGANNVSKEQANIQQQIVSLYDAGDAALKRQLLTMGSLAERAALVESILSKGATRQAAVASELSVLAGAVTGIRRTPRAADGYDPFSAEAAAIRAGVGGASPGAKPVMIKNFAYGGGVSGPIVANTSEWMVKTGAGSAIYNPAMIQKMGLPPGATPIAAGGYIPNMAKGGNPYGLPPEWGAPDYYKGLGKPPETYGPAAPTESQWAQIAKEKTDFLRKVFEKEKNEINRQIAAEERMATLKEKQYAKYQEKEAAKEAKYRERAQKDLAKEEKINDMLREAEAINMAEARKKLEPIAQRAIEKNQVANAKIVISAGNVYSPPETQSLASVRQSMGYMDRQARLITMGTPREQTFTEKGLGKNLYGLSNIQLSKLTDITGGSSGFSRSEMIQSLRGELVGKPTGVDRIGTMVGLSRSGTLQSNFAEAAKWAVDKGDSLESAIKYASDMFIKSGGTMGQLAKTQVKLVSGLVDYEKTVMEAAAAAKQQAIEERRMSQLTRKASQAEITRQTILNAAGERLASGDKFSSLSPQQQAAYKNQLRLQAAQSLGFGGDISGAMMNPAARAQINGAVSKQIAELMAGSGLSGLGTTGVKKESWFSKNPLAAQMAMSMGLPFLGGAIPSFLPESYQKGGTGMGMAVGGLSSGLTGAGFGAAVGSFIPGIGTGLGAGVGAAVGAFSGAIGKMTKSFEELSREIMVANEKIQQDIDAARQINIHQEEITQLKIDGGSERRIYMARQRMLESLSEVSDPSLRSKLQGSKQDREDAISDMIDRKAKLSIPQNISSAVSGVSEKSSFFGNVFESDKEYEENVDRVAKAMAPFLAKQIPKKLAEYQDKLLKDPNFIRTVLKEAGMSQIDIEQFVEGSGLPSPSRRRQTMGTLQEGTISGISRALEAQKIEKLSDKDSGVKAKQLSSLAALTENYKGQAELARMRLESDQQIRAVQQQIALAQPTLLDTDKLRNQGLYGAMNIRSQMSGQKATEMLAGKSALAATLGKGGDSEEIRKLIEGLSGLGDITNLLQKMSTPQGLLGVGASTSSPEFKKQLLDLQRTMQKLDESENEQIRVNTETNRLMLEQLKFTKTYAGARAEYSGAAKAAGVNLATSMRRFDTPDILAAGIAETNLKNLNDEYNRSKGAMSRYEYQGRRMGIGADADGAQKLSNGAAIRYLLNNPNAMGAKDITGSQVTSGLLSEAEWSGQQGKSLKSMADGFKAVFAGMKKDMNDLSKLGAGLANSLSSSLGDAFGDFVTGAKSGKDAFRSFAISVLNDASRMFASQAIQGILGSVFGSVSPTIGRANGGVIPFASGGKVPAMLTGGEYYIGPNSAQKIGYDTLHRLNKYADGGIVKGGSGVKDDVPARLAPGSFIIKKSAVNKLGPDYLDSLVNGKVQHRFFGGMLLGALLGGGIGYATGGKKGAIAGALIGGIGGGLAQNYSQTGSMFKTDANAGMFQFSSSVANTPAGYEVGVGAPAAAAKPPMPMWQKAAWGLGAAALLGGVSNMLAPKDPKFTPWTKAQITENRKKMEAEQKGMTAPAGLYPWLSPNPNGGSNMMGYVLPPTRRMYAKGGEVGAFSPLLSFGENNLGQMGGVSSPARQMYAGGMAGNSSTPLMFGDMSHGTIGRVTSPARRMYANDGAVGMSSPLFMSEGGAIGATGSVDSGVTTPTGSTRAGGGSTSNVSVKIEINNNGQTSSSASSDNKDGQGGFGAEFAQKLQKQVQGIVQQELVNQSRSDGFFAQKNRFVQR